MDGRLNDVIARALLTVLFGALAGGLTNSVAVWMLFHPYQPPRVGRWRIQLLQGAIPKNKARLASSIGRTVGTKLLTPEDLSRTLAEPGFRAAFDDRLGSFLEVVLERERGSLAELLPPPMLEEVRGLLVQLEISLAERLDQYLAGEEFAESARRWAARMAEDLRDVPLGTLLTPEREAAIAVAADRWIGDLVEGPGFENAIQEYVDRTAERLLQPDRTFQELLPQGLVTAVERAIAGYMPIALERLGGLLDEPGARDRVRAILHELLERFMRDMKFHQRLVASLFITSDTVDRVIQAIEAEGANKISELLQDPAVRDAMARGVNDAIVEFLRRPVVSVLGAADDASVVEARRTVAGWALSLARDAQTRSFLLERLRTMLTKAEDRTWGDIFQHLPPERVADAVVAAARAERAGELYRDAARRLGAQLLNRPIGRLGAHLPEGTTMRARETLAEPLWQWAQEQVPAIAGRLDITRRVEAKINEFPTKQVEDIIRGVIEKELRLIVKLGYVLGAFIGLGSALLATLF
jgi:uncharacterized membrane protein YheB (UPF0754 family)